MTLSNAHKARASGRAMNLQDPLISAHTLAQTSTHTHTHTNMHTNTETVVTQKAKQLWPKGLTA